MSKLCKAVLYGATIEYDFLGLTARVVCGDKRQSFTSELDPQTGHSQEPSAFQQAQAWAKDQHKVALATAADTKRQKIKQAVDEAKAKRKPPAAQERDTKQ